MDFIAFSSMTPIAEFPFQVLWASVFSLCFGCYFSKIQKKKISLLMLRHISYQRYNDNDKPLFYAEQLAGNKSKQFERLLSGTVLPRNFS